MDEITPAWLSWKIHVIMNSSNYVVDFLSNWKRWHVWPLRRVACSAAGWYGYMGSGDCPLQFLTEKWILFQYEGAYFVHRIVLYPPRFLTSRRPPAYVTLPAFCLSSLLILRVGVWLARRICMQANWSIINNFFLSFFWEKCTRR